MFFQFLTIWNAQLSPMVTANASSCCAKQLECPSSSLCFFSPLFPDCEQRLWTGVQATAGISVSSWRKGHLGRISVVQEETSIKWSYNKQAGKKKTTSEWKENTVSGQIVAGLHAEPAPMAILCWWHSLFLAEATSPCGSLWAVWGPVRCCRFPTFQLCSRIAPLSPGCLPSQFPLLSCTVRPAQAPSPGDP